MLFVTDGRAHTAFQRFAGDLVAHGGDPAPITDVCMAMNPAYQRGAVETPDHWPAAQHALLDALSPTHLVTAKG